MTNSTPSAAAKGRSGIFGKFVGAAVLGGLFWFTRNIKSGATQDSHAAAFADRETDRQILDQTRSADPAGMRDAPRRDWDRADEAAAGSFPTSDPPAY